MVDRRNQILQTAVQMIADEGYASLTMRALARAVGMKLGALQYHFRTSEEMWRAVVGYIGESYRCSFMSLRGDDDSLGVCQIVEFVLDDAAGSALVGDSLWPQLWAMQQVEPLVSDLVEDIYASYVEVLEEALKDAGGSSPRAEALCLMSLIEGSTIFLGQNRRWHNDANEVRRTLLEFINTQYGEKS